MDNTTDRSELIHEIETIASEQGVSLDFTNGIVSLQRNEQSEQFDWLQPGGVQTTLDWLQNHAQ